MCGVGGGLLEGGGLFERGCLIEDLRYLAKARAIIYKGSWLRFRSLP